MPCPHVSDMDGEVYLVGLWLRSTSQLPGAGLSNQSPILLFRLLQLDHQFVVFLLRRLGARCT